MNLVQSHLKLIQSVSLLLIFSVLCLSIEPSDSNILWRLPSLFSGLPLLINNWVEYLMYDWMPIQVYDPEIEEYEQRALLKEVTRAISGYARYYLVELKRLLPLRVGTLLVKIAGPVGRHFHGLSLLVAQFS